MCECDPYLIIPTTQIVTMAPLPDSVSALSIVIPALDEKGGIRAVLGELIAVVSTLDLDHWEILVVDDGSSDGTGDEARRVEGTRVLRHEARRGYGAALKTGIRNARYPWILITDADGTYPAEAVPRLIEAIAEKRATMAVGARIGASVAIAWVRRPAKWVLGRFANYVAGQRIPDLNSGLRLFPAELARGWFNLLPDGFSFTTTITLAATSTGRQVSYVPIDYYSRVGKSKIRPIRDTLNFFQLATRMALYFAPLKVFLPLSAGVLALGVAWGMASYFLLGRLADASTLVLIVAALQLAALGMVAELISVRSPRL